MPSVCYFRWQGSQSYFTTWLIAFSIFSLLSPIRIVIARVPRTLRHRRITPLGSPGCGYAVEILAQSSTTLISVLQFSVLKVIGLKVQMPNDGISDRWTF